MPWIPALISGAVELFKGRQERKAAKDAATAKLKINVQKGKHELQMTDADWESISASSMEGSWKDEWMVLVATAPIVTLFIGAAVTIFSPETGTRVLDAGRQMVDILNGIDTSSTYGIVLLAAVSASLGIRLIKRR